MLLYAFLAQDTSAAITSGVMGAVVALLVTIGRLNRGKKRILITDYRRGVRFVGGVFAGILEPGIHRFDTRKEQITLVDMRPQPIVIERLAFQGAVGSPGVISIGTELFIRDPHLAATTLREEIKDAYVIVRDTVRAVAARQVIGGIGDNVSTVADGVTQATNEALGKFGMGVSPVEVTELWAGSPNLQTVGGSGVVQ